MRTSPLPTLAACLSIGVLAALAALGGGSEAAHAAMLAPAAATSDCEALPVAAPPASPSPSPSTSSASASAPASSSAPASPSASTSPSATDSSSATPTASAADTASTAALIVATPVDLCISVSASQASVRQGQTGTWSVQVWSQNGPVYGVSVTLAGSVNGQLPTFSSTCPGGDGGTTCDVGDVGTATTASSDTMQAQLTIPSGTAAGASVTLTAVADANPALAATPTAAAGVSVTAAPAAASSASAAASASASASSSGSSSTVSGAAAVAASTPTVATPASTTAGASPVTIPGIQSIPSLVASGTSPVSAVNAVTNAGSIAGLLPTISPAGGATPPTAGLVTAPVADNPGGTAGRASASESAFVIPTATAETVGVIVLLVVAGLIFRLKASKLPRIAPDQTANGAQPGTGPSKLPALFPLRRQRSDSAK